MYIGKRSDASSTGGEEYLGTRSDGLGLEAHARLRLRRPRKGGGRRRSGGGLLIIRTGTGIFSLEEPGRGTSKERTTRYVVGRKKEGVEVCRWEGYVGGE